MAIEEEALLARLGPEQRHPSRFRSSIEDRPVSSHAAPTGPPQPFEQRMRRKYLAHRGLPAIEARQVRDSEGPLAAAPVSKAIHGKAEAGQLVKRTDENGDPRRGHGGNIGRSVGFMRTRLMFLLSPSGNCSAPPPVDVDINDALGGQLRSKPVGWPLISGWNCWLLSSGYRTGDLISEMV